jgi:hypothetical protein
MRSSRRAPHPATGEAKASGTPGIPAPLPADGSTMEGIAYSGGIEDIARFRTAGEDAD